MKKIIFLLATALMLGGAAYTVNNYNKINSNKSTATNTSTPKVINAPLDNNINLNNDKTNNNAVGINQNSIKIKAKDFKLKDLNGKEVSLSDLRGKKVFLNFWATWCPPCVNEMPEIEKLYQETKDGDLVIVAVNLGEPSRDVKTFIDQNKYNFKVLLDSEQSVAEQYGISAIPTSFFIDKDGNIAAKNTGPMSVTQMKEYMKNLDK